MLQKVRHDTQHKYIQHNNIQHDDIQHNDIQHDTQNNVYLATSSINSTQHKQHCITNNNMALW
jgi:hypothetical protein